MDAGTTIGIGAAIAVVVAVIKMALPGLPSRVVPVLVLALAAALVVLQAIAVAPIDRAGLFDLVLQIIMQTAAALGLREGAVAAFPKVSPPRA